MYAGIGIRYWYIGSVYYFELKDKAGYLKAGFSKNGSGITKTGKVFQMVSPAYKVQLAIIINAS